MKKIIITFLTFFICINNFQAQSLNTNAIVAMDMDSKRIFYEKNKDDKRLIASTTKIMTLITAIENGNLTDLVEAKEEVLTMYGSNIYLEYHEKMLLLDLLYGLFLRSGNDAAVVIAREVGGNIENFVKMMNDNAKRLNLRNTIYNNPHGLDEETKNYSTAYDLALLYSYAYKNSIFREISKTKYYSCYSSFKYYKWKNRNKLLFKYEKSTGGKTGYTPLAKKVLVTSASDNDLDVVISSFNSIYDYDLHESLYKDIFYNYKKVLILDKNNFNVKNNPFKGKLYIKSSFSYPLKKDEENKIIKKIEFYKINPKNNSKVGKIYIYLDESLIGARNIYYKSK